MAKSSGQGSWGYSNPSNETGSGDSPDTNGKDLYFGGYGEITSRHASPGGSMFASANSDIGRAVSGGPAKGEDNPANSGSED